VENRPDPARKENRKFTAADEQECDPVGMLTERV
jgi:hypothetical protein